MNFLLSSLLSVIFISFLEGVSDIPVVEELLVMKLTERRHRSYQVKVDAANMLKEKERAKARVTESARKNSATKRRNCRKRTDRDPSEVDPQSSAGRAILSSLGIALTDSGESSPCPSGNSITASLTVDGAARTVSDQRQRLSQSQQQQQQQNMLMMGECDKDQGDDDDIDQQEEGEGEESSNAMDTSIIGESGVQLRKEGDDDYDGDDIFEEEGGRGYMIATRGEGRSDSLVSPPVPPLAGTPSLFMDELQGAFTPEEASSPVLLLPLPRHASPEDLGDENEDEDDDIKDLRDLQQRVQQQQEEEERRELQREVEQARAISMGLVHEGSSDVDAVGVGAADGEALADIDTAEYEEAQSHAMYLEALIGSNQHSRVQYSAVRYSVTPIVMRKAQSYIIQSTDHSTLFSFSLLIVA